MDNPSSPNAMRPQSEQAMEARQLERAEADCASQGKHAEAKRVEPATTYGCVSADDPVYKAQQEALKRAK